ncbi:hypothetical protein HUA78_07050 [Myxococcus sp. CA033]|uniref:hypothetical protein n=1 Tax=Myxococcus sp. CA033 TaxID=2741516 RepID=UPI00157A3CDF|nr:hypothetical protein [Myxococcus sp. CA033]NTX34188.1 hypothetical protein [Myxococcus sp. CA033]
MTSVAMLSLWLLLGTSPPPAAVAVEQAVAEAEDAVEANAPNGYRDATGTVDSVTEGPLRVTMHGAVLKPQRGYWAAQVVLNNSGSQALPVRIAFSPAYGDTSRSAMRHVEVGPRQRVVTWVPLPVAWHSVTLRVDSPGLKPIVESLYADSDRFEPVLSVGTVSEFETSTGLTKTGERDEPYFSIRFLDAKDAPRELAAYVGFQLVVVTAEAAAVPADVWAVLEAYAATGGTLVVTRPSRDLRERLPLLPEAASTQSQYGFGQVWRCLESKFECASLIRGGSVGIEAYQRGVVIPLGMTQRWVAPLMQTKDPRPLLSNASTPVGRFLLVITAFALVVGPGAWWLARRRGPVSVLIMVPAVSVVTCLALIFWSVLVDGFAVHTSRYSLTWLDGARARAVTAGLSAWYANLSPDALHLPASSVLLPPPDLDDALADLDWTAGLTVGDGFLPPRTYREWGEVAVLPSRARLVLKREGDAPRVQNALGARLEEGYVRLDGTVRRLPALSDGEEGALGAPEPEPGNVADTLVGQHLGDGAGLRLSNALTPFSADLSEGGFIARLSGQGPLPSSGMPSEVETAVHLVRGEVRP